MTIGPVAVGRTYFIPAALFQRLVARADFWTATASSADHPRSITWSRLTIHNLLPVTLGNIVGGAVLLGLTYWFVYLRPSDVNSDRTT